LAYWRKYFLGPVVSIGGKENQNSKMLPRKTSTLPFWGVLNNDSMVRLSVRKEILA
jgi:hypothetical protein